MAYPLDSALFQWEDGYRRLREQSDDPRNTARLDRAVEAIRDELRRRIGPTFSASELADLYGRGTDWCLDAARWAAPEQSTELDPQAIIDGSFYLHLRGAGDWSGGRLVPTD
jgi:hypothetical protein